MSRDRPQPDRAPDAVQVSVLVPLHDEEENVGPMHQVLGAALEPLGLRYELLFVDDGSTDGTALELQRLEAEDPDLVVLRHSQCRGKAAAIESALLRAAGTWVLIIDGDMQYDPRDIPLLLDALKSGGDVVSGRRDEPRV